MSVTFSFQPPWHSNFHIHCQWKSLSTPVSHWLFTRCLRAFPLVFHCRFCRLEISPQLAFTLHIHVFFSTKTKQQWFNWIKRTERVPTNTHKPQNQYECSWILNAPYCGHHSIYWTYELLRSIINCYYYSHFLTSDFPFAFTIDVVFI